MIVSEVIELARSSELKQLAVSKDRVAILGFINMGILEIHKRFKLIDQEAVITMVADKKTYLLDGTDVDVAIDLSRNSLLMVNEAFDYTGQQLRINDDSDLESLATPEYNTIEVPDNVLLPGEVLSLIYRATPNFVTSEQATIRLPMQFLEALLHYVGYRAHASVRGDDKFQNEAHYKRFEKSLAIITLKGLFTEDSLHSHKFTERGFV